MVCLKWMHAHIMAAACISPEKHILPSTCFHALKGKMALTGHCKGAAQCTRGAVQASA
jgi:hypothetical protein